MSAEAGAPPILQSVQLWLQAGARILVEQLDWQVAAGQCWSIVGRNGAGKSSLLRVFAGLALPAAGRVLVDGRAADAWPVAALARRRAYLPQSRSDAFGYRVLDAVLGARHPYHDGRYWDGSDDHRQALAALAELDAAHLAERDVRTLSGGERQRVAIATVFAQRSPLLLLDEPAAALDLAHQAALMRCLDARRRAQHAIVMVGHDLNLAQEVATHALLLLPDGAWIAGAADAVLSAQNLQECLGHPIERLQHGRRVVFLPARGAS